MIKQLFYSGGSVKSDSNHPAIKRRFGRFIKRRNYSLANWQLGDVNDKCIVLITQAADLTYWKRFKHKGVVLIFEVNDPYLLEREDSLKGFFRGTFKFFIRRHTHLEFDYKKTIIDLCKSVDHVVVGHQMVYDLLKTVTPNIHFIPDYSVSNSLKIKEDFQLSQTGEINIFWEGLGSSYIPFEDINRIFKEMEGYNFIFHFVTDLTYNAIADIFDKKYVFEVAKRKAPDMYRQFRFYQWSEFSYNNIGILCDFAIIPLPLDNSMNYYKPENKLIQMWRMGVPTIVSAIPSYKKVFNAASLTECCENDSEWINKITRFAEDLKSRERNAKVGFEYAEKHYSDEAIDVMWDNVLLSASK